MRGSLLSHRDDRCRCIFVRAACRAWSVSGTWICSQSTGSVSGTDLLTKYRVCLGDMDLLTKYKVCLGDMDLLTKYRVCLGDMDLLTKYMVCLGDMDLLTKYRVCHGDMDLLTKYRVCLGNGSAHKVQGLSREWICSEVQGAAEGRIYVEDTRYLRDGSAQKTQSVSGGTDLRKHKVYLRDGSAQKTHGVSGGTDLRKHKVFLGGQISENTRCIWGDRSQKTQGVCGGQISENTRCIWGTGLLRKHTVYVGDRSQKTHGVSGGQICSENTRCIWGTDMLRKLSAKWKSDAWHVEHTYLSTCQHLWPVTLQTRCEVGPLANSRVDVKCAVSSVILCQHHAFLSRGPRLCCVLYLSPSITETPLIITPSLKMLLHLLLHGEGK